MELISFAGVLALVYAGYYGGALLQEATKGKKAQDGLHSQPAARVAYETGETLKVPAPVAAPSPVEMEMRPGEAVGASAGTGYSPPEKPRRKAGLPADLGLETITPAGIDVTVEALRELLTEA